MKKLNDFITSINDFGSLSDSDKVIFLSYFGTELLKNPDVTTKNLRDFYNQADLPSPQNFGGEVKQLLRSKKFIKTSNGYKLSRFAKEEVVATINSQKRSSKKYGRQVIISFESLHPLVKKVSRGLFNNGHYSQAIFEAYKAIVNEVKNVSGINNLDGKPLMERVFSLNNPMIKFNNLQTQSDQDEQVGLMLLFSGAALGIRNPKAHDNVTQKDPIRTLAYLSLAALLLDRIDERVK